ncbi:MAG: phage major tail tube protein [Lachnospiraceae bacterium]|nr:phage major tail tube protein [Lachnospiraceae bacterium]
MPRVDETVIGFAVYEDTVEYLGISEATLPEISNIVEEISGAGINGKYESPILGQIEPMTLTLNFRVVTRNAIKLFEPRRHEITLMAAQQNQDPTKGNVGVTSVKHVLIINPKKLNPGKLATASAADVSGEYSVTYYAMYADGKKMLEIDPINYIFYVNGQDDRWEQIRKALGKQ